MAANYCLPVDNDYRIGIVEVGNNCSNQNTINHYIKIGFIVR